MKLSQIQPSKSKIDMIPLMDSMFLILVCFLYSVLSMSVYQGIPVSLPNSTAAVESQNPELTITIDTAGTVYINKVATERSLVADQLSRISKTSDIYVSADQNTAHKHVIYVLDTLRKLNLTNISLETQNTPSQ